MLKHYDKYDSILMPLNPADPHYLSFEKMVLPVAVERGMGIQGMKSTANAMLLTQVHLRDCLSYVLSLPIHCLAVGCTTIGQIEDDVPRLECWKRDTSPRASVYRYQDGVQA